MHPELERTPDTLDVKSLGPNTFGLMKQVRKASTVVLKGTKSLVKLGKFTETERIQTAGVPIAMVAEEQMVPSRSNLSFSLEVSDDDDDVNDDDDDDDVRMFEPLKEPVNEASTARKPPQAVPDTKSPSGSDKDDSNASLMSRKRRRRDPRSGVLITKPIQQLTSNVEPAQVNQDDQSPIFYEDLLANEEIFSSRSSSTPPPPEHDYASIKLAKLIAFQESIPQSRGKGISIGS
ncbi:unnamed protein product [Lactuca saligna]|uniref:Uncharacterized protein n=1 Tax=Lactuca saligna TaxID=75948 RepID=A0AA36E8W8_LACSI|nr:unnamed protein product [Lactuca saligna]